MTQVVHRLLPHPVSPGLGVEDMCCQLQCAADGLHLSFRIQGKLAQLELPSFRGLHRADRLWERSCFEVFLSAGKAYQEWNFAPSGAWAHYAFDDYRKAKNLPKLVPPTYIRHTAATDRFVLDVRLPAEALALGATRCGISSVLTDGRGPCAYWALRHPRSRPDFHDPDSFILNL